MNCSHATLGKNIRTLRNARGLSQEALAQDAQITQSHLGCIERGRGTVSYTHLTLPTIA